MSFEVGGDALTNFPGATSVSHGESADALDVTVLGENDRSFVEGLTDPGEITVSGIGDSPVSAGDETTIGEGLDAVTVIVTDVSYDETVDGVPTWSATCKAGVYTP